MNTPDQTPSEADKECAAYCDYLARRLTYPEVSMTTVVMRHRLAAEAPLRAEIAARDRWIADLRIALMDVHTRLMKRIHEATLNESAADGTQSLGRTVSVALDRTLSDYSTP